MKRQRPLYGPTTEKPTPLFLGAISWMDMYYRARITLNLKLFVNVYLINQNFYLDI